MPWDVSLKAKIKKLQRELREYKELLRSIERPITKEEKEKFIDFTNRRQAWNYKKSKYLNTKP